MCVICVYNMSMASSYNSVELFMLYIYIFCLDSVLLFVNINTFEINSSKALFNSLYVYIKRIRIECKNIFFCITK